MQRKNFLKSSIGLLSAGVFWGYYKKTALLPVTTTSAGAGSCAAAPSETEGPFPYPGGEETNPLNRADVSGGQIGVPFLLTFTLVNVANNCALLAGYRIDIWHCNAKGYYSGYSDQPGVNGTMNYAGVNWLRGYQTTAATGKVMFTTIYPGWYQSRATHIHFEIYKGASMVKTGQLTMPENISDAIHVTADYNGTVNDTRNIDDNVFGNAATNLAIETMAVTGSIITGYNATQTIGIEV